MNSQTSFLCPQCGGAKASADFAATVTFAFDADGLRHVVMGAVLDSQPANIHCADCGDVPVPENTDNLFTVIEAQAPYRLRRDLDDEIVFFQKG